MFKWLKYFWVAPLDDKGGFKFQINIPLGRKKKKKDDKKCKH